MTPHCRELHVHCYRILGSVADDTLQETLLSARQSLQGIRRTIKPAFESTQVR